MHGHRMHLAAFLREAAYGEQQLEGCREQLVQGPSFDSLQCFQLLDTRVSGCLTALDLRLFLSKYKVHVSPEEAQALAKAMGADTSGRVSYSGFLAFLLPASRWEREKAIQKESASLDFQEEYALVRLLEHEVELNRQLTPLRQKLLSNASLLEAFHTLEDAGNYSYWNSRQVLRFSEEQGFRLDERALKGLFRRLDRNRDGKIDYADFVDSLMVLEASSPIADIPIVPAIKPTIPQRSAALPLRQNRSRQDAFDPVPSPYIPSRKQPVPRQEATSRSTGDSHYKDRLSLSRPLRLPPDTDRVTSIPLDQDDLNDRVPLDNVRLTAGSSYPKRESARGTATAFTTFLKEQLGHLHTLEKSRQDLAMCRDFHVSAGFSLLSKGNRRLSLQDFCISLRKLGISALESTFQSLFRAFDRNGDLELDLGEFSDMVRPASYEFSNLMNRRPVAQLEGETVGHMRKVLERLVDYEEFSERASKRLLQDRSFDSRKAFELLDTSGLGYFTRKGLSDFLSKEQIQASEEELSSLFKRYDLNSNNRVPFAEFLRALRQH